MRTVPSALAWLLHPALTALGVLWTELSRMLVSPGSQFSLLSLASALAIAAVVFARQRRARGRRVRLKVLARALFPRRILRSASSRADLGFALLNIFATGALIGWALLSAGAVSHWAQGALAGLFGPRAPLGLAPWATAAGMTALLFLVYEFAYWLDHWLSHAVPLLWEFHRVHHSAETLSPLTVFRVHPVESLKFANISALLLGLAHGAATWLIGGPAHETAVGGSNVILLAFILTTLHLQHSHVWIAFTGGWGRVFASPAHHQIHHSADPAHFGKNLGSCLALFDWLFGTLRIPTRERERLVFGVEPGQERPHTAVGGLVTPFVRAIATLRRSPAPSVHQPLIVVGGLVPATRDHEGARSAPVASTERNAPPRAVRVIF